MAVLTLGTQRDLTNDMLIKGIIDSVTTVNQFYQALPFKGIEGNALAYNREEAGADQIGLVGAVNTAHTSINKDQQKFTRVSTELTTLIGDAQVNGLIQAVGSDYNDATAVQVAAKAKGIGRKYMDLLINGNKDVASAADTTQAITGAATNDAAAAIIDQLLFDVNATLNGSPIAIGDLDTAAELDAASNVVSVGTQTFLSAFTTGGAFTATGAAMYNAAVNLLNGNTGFDGIDSFVAGGANDIGTAGAGSTLDRLDVMIDRCHDKDGMVDYMMMNSAAVRKVTAAFRAAGTGFEMMDVKTSSGGVMAVQSYRGVPIYRNDFIGGGTTISGFGGGDGDDTTTVYTGTIDDGSYTHGICGLTAKRSAGMQVQKLGAREDVDADITRVKWYCGLAHFSELGLVKGLL